MVPILPKFETVQPLKLRNQNSGRRRLNSIYDHFAMLYSLFSERNVLIVLFSQIHTNELKPHSSNVHYTVKMHECCCLPPRHNECTLQSGCFFFSDMTTRIAVDTFCEYAYSPQAIFLRLTLLFFIEISCSEYCSATVINK